MQLFVDNMDKEGGKIKEVQTSYGPFILIPFEKMKLLDRFQEQMRRDARYLHVYDVRLQMWLSNTGVNVTEVSRNVRELTRDQDLDYQIFVDSLI